MRHSLGTTSWLGRVWRVRAANSDDSGATSLLRRNTGAQRPGSGETARRSDPSTCANVGARPCPKRRFSPKAGSCADLGRFRGPQTRNPPKQGRYARNDAQRPGSGEPLHPHAPIPPKPRQCAGLSGSTSRPWRITVTRYASFSQAGTMLEQTPRINPA